MAKHKTVSLVLGSGGARGMAHVGVIHWLLENQYQIKSISGSSIGALVGGVYAIDKLDEFEQWMCAVNRRDIFALLDISWDSGGLFKGDRFIDVLRNIIGDTMISDLPMPYTAVATNLQTGKEVWIDDGLLIDAIRASISIPLFFTPYKYNNSLLIDGGVLNPVPIAPTFSDFTDLTIAVNVSGGFKKHIHQPVTTVEPQKNSSRLSEKIHRFIHDMKDRASSYIQTSTELDMDMIDIAYQSYDAMQSTIARQKLAAYPADITLEIPRNCCRLLEFDRSRELVKYGYELARENIPKLE